METFDDLLGNEPAETGAGRVGTPGNKNGGRPKGTPNKLTTIVKDAIRDSLTPAALDVKRRRVYDATYARELREQRNAGADEQAASRAAHVVASGAADAITEASPADYLQWLATAEPRAYASLLAKLIPTQLVGEDDGPLKFERIERVIVQPKKAAK